jgi:hypothetical protein
MGAISGLLGFAGGANGTGFAGPTAAPITQTTNPADLANAQSGVNNSMGSQQALLSALQNQNGLGNQSQVYGQLQGVANGTGPNPAQAMLNQQTGQNVANQASLMAGQRGAASNVGLMARQAAQQGAATQQQAVGQGASMQANQSLNALGAAGNMANTMAGNQVGQVNANTSAQQQEQANLLGAAGNLNNTGVSMQSNINNANAGLANTQMQGQQGLIGGLMKSLSSAGGMASGAAGGQVQGYDEGGDVAPANIGSPSFSTDAGAAALANAFPGDSSSSGGGGGGGGGIMSMLPMLAAAMADGGAVQPMPQMGITAAGPQSPFGQFLASNAGKVSGASVGSVSFGGSNAGAQALQQGVAAALSKKQPAPQGTTSATQGYGPDAEVTSDNTSASDLANMSTQMAARGGPINGKAGGKVPGKPKVKGAVNSYANDTVPALLSAGEIVLPRSVTQSSDPVRGAAQFVQSVLNKRKMGK